MNHTKQSIIKLHPYTYCPYNTLISVNFTREPKQQHAINNCFAIEQ